MILNKKILNNFFLTFLLVTISGGILAGCSDRELPVDEGVQKFGDIRDECVAAIRADDEEWVKELLIEEPLLITAPHPSTGDTPLHVAAQTGNIAIIKILLENGADPYTQNDEGETTFEIVERMGWGDEVKDLFQ